MLSEEKIKAVSEVLTGLTRLEWIIIKSAVDEMYALASGKLILDNTGVCERN